MKGPILTVANFHSFTLATNFQELARTSPSPAAANDGSTIVLAEDHVAVRQRLKDLLNQEKDFQIVGEAADGLQAVELVAELQPDILLTDLMMPKLNGFDVISRIRLTHSKTRIVVVSVSADKPYVLEAFRRGANGFVQKESSGTDLVAALRQVLAGGCFCGPPGSSGWLAEAQPDCEAGTLDLFETLTEPQRRWLGMAAGGLTDAEIAEHLRLQPATVEQFRAALMKKFNLHSQAELVRFAEQKGLN